MIFSVVSFSCSRQAMIFSMVSFSCSHVLRWLGDFARAAVCPFLCWSYLPCINDRSLMRNSLQIVAMSLTGSTVSSAWMTSSSSNARMTWIMPSTAWMCDRKALPKPSPLEAPEMRPAMSTTVTNAFTSLAGLCCATSQSNLSSSKKARVSVGSIVQNGTFAVFEWCDLLRELYKVLLPTFGMPTNPTFNDFVKRPNIHGPMVGSAAAFLGGIASAYLIENGGQLARGDE